MVVMSDEILLKCTATTNSERKYAVDLDLLEILKQCSNSVRLSENVKNEKALKKNKQTKPPSSIKVTGSWMF